ncbi:MAG: enoyl-CoA hydratase-related protein [Halieaceae bacterium]|nr:enoyl-CoA hydratase-related protein [Halieaceae bacterium]
MSLPTTESIQLEQKNGWLTIWFDGIENRNALTDQRVAETLAVLNAVADDRTVRGITLRGKGGVFSAGGDLNSFRKFAEAPDADVIEMSKSIAYLLNRLNTMPQVTVALVEGAAIAGGLGIVCCCDVAICQSSAKFAFSETMIGISPAQIARFVMQKLGYAKGRRLMLTAARFDGAEAGNLGLADFVADDVERLEVLETIVRRDVLKCAPGAIAATKELILDLPYIDPDSVADVAGQNFTNRLKSDEGKEGVSSFLEKRAPNWAQEP